jgi:alkanesulfonate monooxygenase SsuD/methylene tetrahydromethanopterin reductase-like flavin-dependent oxidoreductase (luciferase family)
MTDYGHEPEFGVFITPSSQQPQAVVDLAQLADRAGIDLVTFQDHPYQPAFLDTWTLMSYVAAQTQRARLAGNVLNLPLRSPAVLARSVASLDLLSGGRAELGIGAGGFREAIEAMGGPRLRPGEAVDALAEALEIIRAVWDTGIRGGIRFAGQHYQLSGAKRGPAPAHPVSIWLGAYKPRMLQLTGRLADGWLPSLSYLQAGQLTAGNAVIDEAASAAGRDPASVRRLLNISGRFAPVAAGMLDGPPGHWASQLAELALAEGISTFILVTDDPDTIRTYADEVAPEVRELVGAGRANLATSSGGRPDDQPIERTGGATGLSADVAAAQGPDRAVLSVQPTPDDGVRLSSTRLWDETTRPTRPTDPAAVRYDPAGQAASAQLVAVHDMLRQQLTDIRDLIMQVQKGTKDAGQARSELSQMTMRQNNWTMGAYCESYCRVVTQHHSAEDAAVFPYLRAREPALGPVLDRLHEEHVIIHGAMDAVDKALVNVVTMPGRVAELQDTVDLLTDTLFSHLAYEERELIEPLARYGFYESR